MGLCAVIIPTDHLLVISCVCLSPSAHICYDEGVISKEEELSG